MRLVMPFCGEDKMTRSHNVLSRNVGVTDQWYNGWCLQNWCSSCSHDVLQDLVNTSWTSFMKCKQYCTPVQVERISCLPSEPHILFLVCASYNKMTKLRWLI